MCFSCPGLSASSSFVLEKDNAHLGKAPFHVSSEHLPEPIIAQHMGDGKLKIYLYVYALGKKFYPKAFALRQLLRSTMVWGTTILVDMRLGFSAWLISWEAASNPS